MGKAIRFLAIDMAGWYQAKTRTGGWLPKVSGYDVKDLDKGCAGDGSEIIAVRCFFETQDTSGGDLYEAVYRVSDVGKGFYPYQTDDDTRAGMDGYAGDGNPIDRFELKIAAVGETVKETAKETVKETSKETGKETAKPSEGSTAKTLTPGEEIAYAGSRISYSRPSQHNPSTGANPGTKAFKRVYGGTWKRKDTKSAAPRVYNVEGRSCDRSVSCAVLASGRDDGMHRTVDGIIEHMDKSPDWKCLGRWDGKETSLQPGDVLARSKKWAGVSSNHVCMYIGDEIAKLAYAKHLKGTDADKGAPTSTTRWMSGHLNGGNPPNRGYAPCLGDRKYAHADTKMKVWRYVGKKKSSKYTGLLG